MDRIRFSSSARLGIWDFLRNDKESFLNSLNSFLSNNSNGILESNNFEFIPVEDSNLSSLTAVIDKILTRGNPTLIDFDFESKNLRSH